MFINMMYISTKHCTSHIVRNNCLPHERRSPCISGVTGQYSPRALIRSFPQSLTHALSRSRQNHHDLLLHTAYTLCASYADKPPANLITLRWYYSLTRLKAIRRKSFVSSLLLVGNQVIDICWLNIRS